jgi:glucose/arabinose dehydrogenase
LALGNDGTVYVGTLERGVVYALRDEDGDGRAERVFTLVSGLQLPNGVAFRDGALYVAEVNRIIRFSDIGSRLAAPPSAEVIYDRFPKDRHHGWKYLRFGPDGKLYVPVGAPCNICKPDLPYASLTRMNPDGSSFEVYAVGIRNTVGFDWHPDSGELWFTENGRDWLGDDLPAEELNRAPTQGMHFGYPYCHAGDLPDPEFGKERPCKEFVPPAWKFPAHTAPLGVRFYTGNQFPEVYRKQLFVAQHGSWNRSRPQGYQIVVVSFDKSGRVVTDEVFADGWLRPDGEVLGRPVDLLQIEDGSLLVSDDHRGVIYRISYRP